MARERPYRHPGPRSLRRRSGRLALAAVGKDYRIEVKETTTRINGTVVYGIDHTEAAYVLDATGHERALFAWPFNPQDVVHVLRQLA